MLKRIQHERIIHLIVTVFVGMCLMIVFLAAIITTNIYLGILSLILLLLFTAYIFHYRHLENMTQSWYILEDKIIKNEES
jgi:Ca2+/Na+ antiporter